MNLNLAELTGLNSAFGPVAKGACKISLKGDLAVRTDKGYRAFDPETKKLVNVTDFCLDFDQFFYIWPTRKLKVGDVVLFDGRFKCVVEEGDATVKALDYGTSVIEELVPQTHVFMGKTFYGKVINLMGGKFKSGKLIMLSMISKVLGGGQSGDANLLPMLMLGGMKDGATEEDGFLKTFMLTKVLGQNGGDANSFLPLMLLGGGLGKAEGTEDLGSIGKLIMLSQMAGNGSAAGGLDLSKLFMFKMLGNDGSSDLFDFDFFGEKETEGAAPAERAEAN